MIILNIIIIVLLIMYIINKNEQFYIDCNPFGVNLNPENSYKSFIKGWCTNANFNDGPILHELMHNWSNFCIETEGVYELGSNLTSLPIGKYIYSYSLYSNIVCRFFNFFNIY